MAGSLLKNKEFLEGWLKRREEGKLFKGEMEAYWEMAIVPYNCAPLDFDCHKKHQEKVMKIVKDSLKKLEDEQE